MKNEEQKVIKVIRALQTLVVQRPYDKDEAEAILDELRGFYPQYRFYHDPIYRLVVVGTPDCRLTMSGTLLGNADIVLALYSNKVETVKDREGTLETEWQRIRLSQAALGLVPTGSFNETTFAAMATVVKGEPKMTEEEITALIEERRTRYMRH